MSDNRNIPLIYPARSHILTPQTAAHGDADRHIPPPRLHAG